MSENEDVKPDKPDVNGSTISPTPVSRNGKMSDTSALLIEEGLSLLDLKSSVAPTIRPVSPDCFGSSDFGLTSHDVARVKPESFKRVDFDDRLEDINPKKPAWKSWQESVKDSYYKAKRSAESKRDENEFNENVTLGRPRRIRAESPFRALDTSTGFTPSVRSQSTIFNPTLPERSRIATSSSVSNIFTAGSGPYAAPAVNISQGIESRYEDRANNIELMLLKTAPLPKHYKSITKREFKKAPEPSAGSFSEKDDYDFSMYTPRAYYSRPNRDDPDYFDFDLQHSVDMFKRPEGKYTPRGPQDWESKLVTESSTKGTAPISGHMFTKPESDWRNNGTSYLSAALRTPKFWEQRFESIGKHVRDSNPISLESINRRIRTLDDIRKNRPVPNRFTEYRDPDYEDYDDPRSDD